VPFLLVAVPLVPAQAQITGSTFEANDGNLLVNHAGNEDWVNAPNFSSGIDKPSGKNDDSFKGGVDEDTVNPAVGTGAIPNSKDDLARFYLSFEKSATTQAELLYLAWIRNKTSGSADMDFELNQSTATTTDRLPVRTAGDLLVTYEFISTKTPTISIQRWHTAGQAGACVVLAAPPCWAERQDLNSATSEAAVNDGFTTPDPRFLTGGKPTTLASQTFGEAAINLTALNIFSSTGCTHFARAFAKTRSSQSFNASMQDLIAPISIDLSNCLTKTFDITATGGTPSGTTLYAVFTTGGTQHVVALAPTTPGHLGGSDSGVEPGATLTGLHLELRNAAGTVLWRNTDQTETLNGNSTNAGTFSYALTLTPASAENFANHPHVLTATLTGTGSLNGTAQTTAPISGVTVGFRLENGTPSGCGTLTPTSGTTNAAGVVTTTLTSTGACSTTIRAFVDRADSTAGYDSTDVSQTATKTFVAYALSVSPASATNVLGTNHTFTITLTRDTGSGPTGYAGQTVTFTLTNAAATGAHLVSINGAPASGTSGSCTTTSAGTCTVVATATNTGTFTLSASYTTSNASGQGTFTGSGSKTYADFRISVTPASATNEVGVPHTFTVTLERDSGSGYQPYAGQTVALSLNPGTSNAHLVSINGAPASGTSGSCTTSATGTCTVVIVATTPGLATLTATFSTTLASGQLTRTASGTKQYSDFALTVTPLTATNDLGVPHTFTVTLTRNDGSGFSPYAGQVVNLSLNVGTSDGHFTAINGAPASGTTGTCTTRADGTCSVTIVATTPGTITLTASWSQVLSANSTATRTAVATKRYLLLSVSKNACNATAPVGGLLRFTIPWSVAGTTLTNAVITDNLPAGLGYVSASPAPFSAPTPGSTGTVVWHLGNLPDPSSGSVSLVVTLLTSGTQVNTGTFTADGGISKSFSSTVTASNVGAAASGRAYGLSVDLLGSTVIPPTPSVTSGSDSLLTLGIPPLAPTVLSGAVGLLNVSNAPSVTATGAEDEAVASVADIDLNVAGVSIKAKAVQARSDSVATGSTAGTSTVGSEIVDLQINGGSPVDIASPTVLPVIDAAGLIKVSVSVLEPTGASGAALGGVAGAQPQGGLFSSGLTVNGLHIRATTGSTVLADVVVSQAKSQASFPTLTPCANTGPYLIGQAFVAKEDLTSPVTVGLPIGLVTLNAAGGSTTRTINTLDLSALGVTSGTGDTSTVGSLSTMTVDSDAAVQRLKVNLGGAVTLIDATLIHAHASVNSTTPSNAEIAKLTIAGTDICAALAALPLPPPVGPGGICYPAPNTVLLDLTGLLKIVLNEQTTANGVITVNAVHVYVLGAGNPLGLPVGSDLIISSATAGTGS
jgi:hypothetical protein